jgi:hypothetical protein
MTSLVWPPHIIKYFFNFLATQNMVLKMLYSVFCRVTICNGRDDSTYEKVGKRPQVAVPRKPIASKERSTCPFFAAKTTAENLSSKLWRARAYCPDTHFEALSPFKVVILNYHTHALSIHSRLTCPFAA